MQNQTSYPDKFGINDTENIFTTLEHTKQDDLVDEINYSQAMLMLPVTLFMVLLMLVGFCGNAVVVVVFAAKKNKTIANYFMLSLGIIDLISCTLLHPYVIYKLFHFYDSLREETCKVFEFLIHTGLAVQTLVLLSVAIDRYCAVCRPLTFVHSYNRTTLLIASSIVVGTAASIPLLVFYGNKTISLEFEIPNTKGNFNNSMPFETESFNTSEPVTMGIPAAVAMTTETTVLFSDSFLGDDQYYRQDSISYLDVHICHYSDRYDGTLSQGIFGMCMCFMIAFVTATMSVLYILLLKTIIIRQRRVKPDGSFRNPLGSDSFRAQYTKGKTTGQVQGQHQGTGLNQTKVSLVQASGNGNPSKGGSDSKRFEHFVIVSTKINTRSGKNERKRPFIKGIGNKRVLIEEVPHDNTNQEQRETSMDSPGIVSNHHINSQRDVKKRSSVPSSSKTCINNYIETENTISKKKTSEKPLSHSGHRAWTTPSKLVTDSARPVERKSSNVSSISNSEVEMTWRSQRMLTVQDTGERVGVSSSNSSKQLPKIVTFGEENEDSNRHNNQQVSLNQRKGVIKGVKVLFLVTIIFLISWLPFLVLKIMATINPDVWADNLIAGNVFFNLLSHFFFLNNAVNPLIYTFVNSNFREDCRHLFKNVRNKVNQMFAVVH